MVSRNKRWSDTVFAIIFAVMLSLFVLSFSIGLPIYCRLFYFSHIEALEIPQSSGFSRAEIKQAYNELLDYLTLPGREFSTGNMAYSESGKAHFDDCKMLFDLNATVLIISVFSVAILMILKRTGKIGDLKIMGRRASFYSGVLTLLLPVVVGSLAATDFDKAFVVFHKIFFPGKDNWAFNPSADEIIKVLPQEFFMNCAILIGVSVFVWSVSLILYDIIKKR